MTRPDDLDLDELEAAHAKATAGEWDSRYWAGGMSDIIAPDCPDGIADRVREHDAAAIVALHNAFPAHLAYTRALEAEVAALRGVLTNGQASICFLACEHGSKFEPNDPAVMHSNLCDELRAALAATGAA